MKLIGVFSLALYSLVLFSFCAQQKQDEQKKLPEEIIAELDDAPDFKVEIANNLDRCSDIYKENRDQIASMTLNFVQVAKTDAGVDITHREVLSMMADILPDKLQNKTQSFAETAGQYLTLRQQGMSHREAEKGVRGVLKSLSDLSQ